MELYKLRLKRQRHVLSVPFSLLYLCRGADVVHMKAIFETFLAFPLRHATKSRWEHIVIEEEDGEPHFKKLGALFSGLLDVEEDWHAIIPILSITKSNVKLPAERYGTTAMDHRGQTDLYKASIESEERVFPRYIVSPEWKNWRATGAPSPNSAFPPTTYFVTRDRTFVPPCAACPRLGYHEAGECHLGDPECYTHLGKYKANSRMFQKLREYDEIQESMSGVLEE